MRACVRASVRACVCMGTRLCLDACMCAYLNKVMLTVYVTVSVKIDHL